jgi:hypothetical protein
VIRNRGLLKTNSNIHNFNARTNYDLQPPTANLTLFKKEACYAGIKIYNCLPLNLKQLSLDVNKFKSALKRFLLTKSFHSLEQYFPWK